MEIINRLGMADSYFNNIPKHVTVVEYLVHLFPIRVCHSTHNSSIMVYREHEVSLNWNRGVAFISKTMGDPTPHNPYFHVFKGVHRIHVASRNYTNF